MTSIIKKSVFGAMLLTAALTISPANAESVTKGSTGSVTGSQTIFKGSGMIIHGNGKVIVSSLETIGDSVKVILTTPSGALVGSLLIAGSLAKSDLWNAGTILVASAIYGGILLSTTANKVIAYIPDARGKKLTHSSPYSGDA